MSWWNPSTWGKPEKRSDFTSLAMAERFAAITGQRGLAELTGTVQSCISLWEQGLSLADVSDSMLSPSVLHLSARSLALRGEALFLIRDRLIPCSTWEVSTRAGKPTAYRAEIPDVMGSSTETALAAEVLHFRIGSSMAEPWRGTSPLTRQQF